VDCGRSPGKRVQLCDRHVKEGRHLVDESACAAGAGAVHADVRRSGIEEDQLGIFAADIHERMHLRVKPADDFRRGNDFLNEGQVKFLAQTKPSRTGHQQLERRLTDRLAGIL